MMSLSEVISAGLVMGFSASLVCFGWCVPVITPYTATAAQPGVMSGLISSFLFSVGRLLSYLGLLLVFLALRALVPLSPVIESVAVLVSGMILVVSGLASVGILKWRSGLGRLLCQFTAGARSPLYLGMLTGLRPCGPLLAAMAFMLTLPGAFKAGMFMLFFWMASSVLVITLGVVSGGLSMLAGKKLGIDRLRRIAGMAMIFIGCFLLLTGIGGIGAFAA